MFMQYINKIGWFFFYYGQKVFIIILRYIIVSQLGQNGYISPKS